MPFVVAIAVSLLLVLSAPFVGQIRSEIRRAFPGQFVLIIGGIIAIALLAAIAAAVRRIGDHRVQRFGAVALAILIAATYAATNAGDNPESNVVELFHFLQYGLVAFLFYRAWRPAADISVILLPLLAGLIVGTVEEWLQWFIPNRVGEMKDVLLNLVAIATGLLFSMAVDPPPRWHGSIDRPSRRRTVFMAAATLVMFAAFFQVVHLGYRVDDAETGAFESRWAASELLDVQSARRGQWSAQPPPVKLVRLSREDQYLTEGIQHVRERNRLWQAGNLPGAWFENRILEKYYEPVLDTPTHEGTAGHRWPPAQRADAQASVASSTGPTYSSSAYPYPIYTWSRRSFWLAVSVAAGLLLIAGAAA